MLEKLQTTVTAWRRSCCVGFQRASCVVRAKRWLDAFGFLRLESCTRASENDHEDFKRMAMNKSFLRTQDSIQSETTTSENSDRTQRRIQNANITGLEQILLVKIYIAELSRSKLIRMIVPRVLKILHCVLESRIQIHPIRGQSNWRTYGTTMYLSKSSIAQPQKCNSSGTYYQVLPLFTPRSIFRGFSTGKIQNLLKIGSYACLCSTTLNGPKKAIQKLVCTMSKKWQLCDPNRARTLVLPGAHVRKYVVERKFQRTSKKF